MVAFKFYREKAVTQRCCFRGTFEICQEGKQIEVEGHSGFSKRITGFNCTTEEAAIAAFTALVNWKEGDGILDLTQFQTGE